MGEHLLQDSLLIYQHFCSFNQQSSPTSWKAKAAWDFMANRYNCAHDSTLKFQNESILYLMRQGPIQSTFYYYSQKFSIWDQVSRPTSVHGFYDVFVKI